MQYNQQHRRKVAVYIDGFNLYFAIKEKKWNSLLWVDMVRLANSLVRPDQELVGVKYFTARIRNDRDKQKRQNLFLDALGTLQGLKIFYGYYQDNYVICRGCGRGWNDDKEKETDVSIATQMLIDAHTPNFVDDIILITADSDQCPAIRALRALGKHVLVVLPPGRSQYLEIKTAADSHIELTAKKLKCSQLPERITTPTGFVIEKPMEYR